MKLRKIDKVRFDARLTYRGKQKGKRPKTPTDDLARAYQAGATIRQLAAQTGVTFQAVARQLKNAGVAVRPSKEKTIEPRSCWGCGGVFLPQKSNTNYCGQSCVPRLGIHRQKTCKRGHPLSGDNLTRRHAGTSPRCRKCQRIQQRSYRARKAAD